MEKRGLDALLISGTGMMTQRGHLRYMTNWCQPLFEEYFYFPLVGEPLYFSRYVNRANVQSKILGLKTVFPEFGTRLKESSGKDQGKFTATIPGTMVADFVKHQNIRRLGLCGPETMSADFYIDFADSLKNHKMEIEIASDILTSQRMIKSLEEQLWLRRSGVVADLGFEVFRGIAAVGRREFEVFAEVEHAQRLAGAECTFYTMAAGYEPFQKYHDMAYETYSPGDLAFFNTEAAGPGGYFTQLARMVSFGEPSEEVKKAYGCLLEAFDAAIEMLRPGRKACEVYEEAIVKVAHKRGYKLSQHPGHSQGLDIFEPPIISAHDTTVLRSGMMIVLHPRFRTSSGRNVWIGESFMITDDGCQRLHKSDRELTVLPTN
jgi:Xaa-Pro aminopeptidase